MKANSRTTLGIMAREYTGGPPFGKQQYFFEDILKSSQALNPEILAFSPLQFHAGQCKGWRWRDGKWQAETFAAPPLIYERIWPLSAKEQTAFDQARAYLLANGHTFLNPPYLLDEVKDKIRAARLFSELEIPQLEVWPWADLNLAAFAALLRDKKQLFVKPVRGSHGAGISRVSFAEGQFSWQGEDFNRDFPGIEALFSALDAQKDSFFLQEEGRIHPIEGHPHDFRILVQASNRKDFEVSGISLRLGKAQSLVSNFNAGGSVQHLGTMDSFFRKAYGQNVAQIEAKIQELSLEVARKIYNKRGAFFELGLDILLTYDRGPVLLEANGKPGRWTFQILADEAPSPTLRTHYAGLRADMCRKVMEMAQFLSELTSS